MYVLNTKVTGLFILLKIVKEKLPFPSGTATAQLISVLHQLPPPDTGVRHRRGYRQLDAEDDTTFVPPVLAAGEDGQEDEEHERQIVQKEGWYDLIWSFAAAGSVTLAAYFFPALFAIPLFGSYLAGEWLWYFTPSLSYIGQGIIMGFPTTLSMNLGMLVGWAVLSPLSKYSGWAPGPVGDMSNGARGWILWVSLGVMCADSFVSLLPVGFQYIRDLGRKRDHNDPTIQDHETEASDRLVPNSWVLSGLAASLWIGTVLVGLVFGKERIKPWATVLGFVFGMLLSVIGHAIFSRGCYLV